MPIHVFALFLILALSTLGSTTDFLPSFFFFGFEACFN